MFVFHIYNKFQNDQLKKLKKIFKINIGYFYEIIYKYI